MKTLIFLLTLVPAMFLYRGSCSAQDSSKVLRNSAYASLGGEGSVSSAGYEHQFWQKNQLSLRAKIALGLYVSSATWDLFGNGDMSFKFSPDIPVGIEFLAGRNSKFDGAAGVTVGFGPDMYSYEEVKTSMWGWTEFGYRYTDPKSQFMFRLCGVLNFHNLVSASYVEESQSHLDVVPGLTLGFGGNF